MSAGSKRRVPMTVTFFEMLAKPSALPPPSPKGRHAILKAETPTTHFYRYLYDTIGGPYLWVDRKKLTPEALSEIIQHPDNHLYVLYTEGSPAGMAELDFRKDGACNALFIIQDALTRGTLKPGGTIVEGTAGNTGIGLATVANAMGFKTVIVIPDTQSQEKKDALRLLGAELIEVPAVPYRDPDNYVKLSGRLAGQLARTEQHGAIWANQFDNTANRDAHIQGTAPEIWRDTGGRIDGFTCAVGTGGTLAGVAIGLKEKNPNIRIAAADPLGAAIYSWIKHGTLETHGSSITEGIGQGRVTGNLEGAPIDDAYEIADEEMLPIIFDLLQHEGLCLGGSSGINVAAAIRMGREMGPGHTIVTVLADYGNRYQSKLFNPDFLRDKGLPVPPWLAARPKPPPVPYEKP